MMIHCQGGPSAGTFQWPWVLATAIWPSDGGKYVMVSYADNPRGMPCYVHTDLRSDVNRT